MTQETTPDLAAAERICLMLVARRAQQIRTGYDVAHDDDHHAGEIISASWGAPTRLRVAAATGDQALRREMLMEAAAMIVAEVERVDRARERVLAAEG